jgi:hypothetical protein
MLPKVLNQLIADYNEKGTLFINQNNQIYWFNGKRFEYFETITNFKIKDYYCNKDNKLYLLNKLDTYRYYNSKKIKKIKPKFGIQLLIDLYGTDSVTSGIINGEYFEYAISCGVGGCILEEFKDNHSRYVKQFNRHVFNFLGKLILFNCELYCFGQSKNAKFNLKTKKWILFENCPIKFYQKIELIDNLFYLISEINHVWIYDPFVDRWSRYKDKKKN